MSMGGGTSHTTTTQELSPEQRRLIEPVIPIAEQYLKNPPKMYQGSGIVGFNPLQQQAQQMTMNAANSMLPQMQQTGAQYGQQMQGYNNLRGQENFFTSGAVLRPQSNPALQGAIQAASRPTIQNFQEQIMPQITSMAADTGGIGGTRQGIGEGIAARGATQAVADIASSMANTNYQAGLGAMASGFNSANQTQQQQNSLLQNKAGIMGQTLLPAQIKEAVGTQQQQMQQALLSEKVQKFVNEQMIPFSVAQDVASMAFGMPGGTTKSTSSQPGNPMMGMQMGMGALGMLPALIGSSDRRMKENVRKVKVLVDGLVVYVFNYIGNAARRIGLMADEVVRVYPLAVSTDDRGFKRVNYLAVPTWMAIYDVKGAH